MNDTERQPPELPETPARREKQDRPLVFSSEQLLQGRREMWIQHHGEMYRLRLTSRGKLYLTK